MTGTVFVAAFAVIGGWRSVPWCAGTAGVPGVALIGVFVLLIRTWAVVR